MNHSLKIAPAYFEAVLSGDKTFEIRKNDRGFQKGDTVTLLEYCYERGYIDAQRYTGRSQLRVITYVCNYEQKDGYVVIGMKDEECEVTRQRDELLAALNEIANLPSHRQDECGVLAKSAIARAKGGAL